MRNFIFGGQRCATAVAKVVTARATRPPPSPPPPSNMRSTFVDRNPHARVTVGSSAVATFHHTQAVTDCGARPVPLKCVGGYRPPVAAYCRLAAASSSPSSPAAAAAGGNLRASLHEVEMLLEEQQRAQVAELERVGLPRDAFINPPAHFGDRTEQLDAFWGQKFFGNVTHAPRNFGYPWSRWYIRRYGMKKHRYTKRWKIRRYKLASVANLPFSKMIRINMLPELKSKKQGGSKSANLDVDAVATPTVSSQIVSAVNASSGGGRVGKRKRPKSRYT